MTIRIIGIVAVVAMLAAGCVGTSTKASLSGDPLTLVAADDATGAGDEGVAGADGETVAAAAVQPAPKTRPPAPAALAANPPPANSGRDQAVAEIRAKAAASAETGSQEFPNVFATPGGQTAAVKPVGEVETIQDDLQTAGQQSAGDDEAFKKRALLLWRLGQTHAQDTADSIAKDE